jgi:hypothetical protein
VIAVSVFILGAPRTLLAAEAKESTYRGWKTLALSNGLVELQLAPEIGGRVIQFKLGDYEYLWVNDTIAGGKPTATGLSPKGEWMNWGGDKLWPAPQSVWNWPPSVALEQFPHKASIVRASGTTATIMHTSPPDPKAGIQFTRTISMRDGVAGVVLESTMKNIDTKPRRWAVWEVMQLPAADRKGPVYETNLSAYTPFNPKSRFPGGFHIFDENKTNPAWQPDAKTGMMRVHYERTGGKIGLDSVAGWTAIVLGRDGYALVHRFQTFPGKDYPDGDTVEYYTHAPGEFFLDGTTNSITGDPKEIVPYVEAEILSPIVNLKPGESYSFRNEWYVTRIAGDYPIIKGSSGLRVPLP